MSSTHSLRYLALMLLVGCGSGALSAPDRGLLEPEVQVRMPPGQILALSGEVTDLNLRIDIHNRSSETITLDRIELSSLPTADLQFRPTRRNLSRVIEPNKIETIDIWVSALNTTGEIARTAPLEVRGTAVFDSPFGKFRKVFINRVIESGDEPEAE